MSSYEKADFWAQKAKKDAYPARSVYKLQEIDQKFALTAYRSTKGPATFRVLDLGAAPGSWSLYLLRKLSSSICLTAVDLLPLSRRYDRGLFDSANFNFIRGDFNDPTIISRLEAAGPFNLILSDAAPATSGMRLVDSQGSLALAQTVINYADGWLAADGNLVVKLFQDAELKTLLNSLKTSFTTARTYKPKSCRSESFETYLIGLGKQAPGRPLDR